MRAKHVVVVCGAIVLLGLAGWRLLQTDRRQVARQFDRLAQWVSKRAREQALGTALKLQGADTLFAEEVEVAVGERMLAGRYTVRELVGQAALARMSFVELAVEFHDLAVEFPSNGVAHVVCTVQVTGKLTNGERVDEPREIECTLEKTSGRWLFSAFRSVDVLRR
ncbi:MAG: hypothetical protein JXR37_11310 [Kiritimatiellae bacterium]|nr:hypothetical protein [Kiritimatiellia bacterium]